MSERSKSRLDKLYTLLTAFRGCEKHPESTKSSSAIGSHYQSEVMPANKNGGAYLAILPQTEMSSPIHINVMMPSFSYKVWVNRFPYVIR